MKGSEVHLVITQFDGDFFCNSRKLTVQQGRIGLTIDSGNFDANNLPDLVSKIIECRIGKIKLCVKLSRIPEHQRYHSSVRVRPYFNSLSLFFLEIVLNRCWCN